MALHRALLYLLYAITIFAVGYYTATGWSYYTLPDTEDYLHPLHDLYKPAGLVGHGLGIVGSLLMLILLLYSARKRFRSWQRLGNIRYWLDYHIWMGVTGPLLVLYHTSFKFGGIVAVSFWSMVGVALSGVVGRYIYVQIPRSRTGHQLTAGELDDLDRSMQERLSALGVSNEVLCDLQPADDGEVKTSWGNVWKWIVEDFRMPGRLRGIRHKLKAQGNIPSQHIHETIKVAKQKLVLRRRIRFLKSAEGLLHYWHVIHKPFAYVMMIIMVVHVVVAIVFGYKWVWSHG